MNPPRIRRTLSITRSWLRIWWTNKWAWRGCLKLWWEEIHA
jgi:hypothetical protein